jgi:hypothetical protein
MGRFFDIILVGVENAMYRVFNMSWTVGQHTMGMGDIIP